MDNFLNNGSVLPFGLLSQGVDSTMEGFNKTYKNTALRIGIIIHSYPVSDSKNLSKLTTEYDISVFEQNEDRGSSILTYKNCMSSEGLGSVADFFEKTLRVKKNTPINNTFIDTKDQNGAVVLILCLDGMSDKAIILGSMTHPDRKTNLKNELPYLEGEYNGVNIKIANDGSTTFTFKGATDNDGKIIDSSQGQTVAQIEKDGSFQLKHDKITFRLDRNGTATIETSKDVNLKVQGDVNVVASGKAIVNASEVNLNGSAGQILTTITDPVIDTIFGIPTTGIPTVKAG